MNSIQIRPLHFFRRSNHGVFIPTSDKQLQRPVVHGRREYVSADGYFLLQRKEQWRVETLYTLSEDHHHLSRAYYQAGLSQATFPTRRAAVEALETVMEGIEE